MLGVVEMTLVTEEDNFVVKQQAFDRGDGLVRQIARQLNIPDFSANARRAFNNSGTRNDTSIIKAVSLMVASSKVVVPSQD
ncbi:hypothetical protein AJ88_37895 [Mesorhizobium amorphae CCBAU 01583]|nr:hypothetical protein AJ88_37895 [Mesorhizobium amorphae CCBAU 01583]